MRKVSLIIVVFLISTVIAGCGKNISSTAAVNADAAV